MSIPWTNLSLTPVYKLQIVICLSFEKRISIFFCYLELYRNGIQPTPNQSNLQLQQIASSPYFRFTVHNLPLEPNEDSN